MFNLYKVIKVNFCLEQYICCRILFRYDSLCSSWSDAGCSGGLAGRDSDPVPHQSSTLGSLGWRLLGRISSCHGDRVANGWQFTSCLTCEKGGLHQSTALPDSHWIPGRCTIFACLAAPSAALGLEVHEFGARCGISACEDLCLGIIELEERQAECCILVNMIAAHGSTSRLKRPQALS